MIVEPINETVIESLVPSTINRDTQTSFTQWMAAEISQLDQQIRQSDGAVQDLALGKAENLHDVMLEIEKTRTAFQLTMQVRNKVLEGYQEIMRMQV